MLINMEVAVTALTYYSLLDVISAFGGILASAKVLLGYMGMYELIKFGIDMSIMFKRKYRNRWMKTQIKKMKKEFQKHAHEHHHGTNEMLLPEFDPM